MSIPDNMILSLSHRNNNGSYYKKTNFIIDMDSLLYPNNTDMMHSYFIL